MNNLGLGIPVPDYVDENVSDKVVKIILDMLNGSRNKHEHIL